MLNARFTRKGAQGPRWPGSDARRPLVGIMGRVDEKADLEDKILYHYPDYPLTGRPTGIEISFAGWGVRVWFSEPVGDALFEPDLEFREYTCEMDNYFKKIGTILML